MIVQENYNSGLWDLISANEKLKIIDAHNDKSYQLADINLEINNSLPNNKKLVFLYLDNTLNSLSAYISFLATPHALVLLSNTLEVAFKTNLEKKYEPHLIFRLPTRKNPRL